MSVENNFILSQHLFDTSEFIKNTQHNGNIHRAFTGPNLVYVWTVCGQCVKLWSLRVSDGVCNVNPWILNV